MTVNNNNNPPMGSAARPTMGSIAKSLANGPASVPQTKSGRETVTDNCPPAIPYVGCGKRK